MIAGRLPFVADYEQATLYGILNEDPQPLTALRTGVPMELEAVVAKLLRKDAKLRYQTAADVVADLEAIRLLAGSRVTGERSPSATSSTAASSHPLDRPETVRWRRYALWFGAVGLLLGSLVTSTILRLTGPAAGEGLESALDVQLKLTGLDAIVQQDGRFSDRIVALSPDGRLVAYLGDEPERGLIVRSLAKAGPSVTLADYGTQMVFSPDSRSLAWAADGSVYRAPVTGGVPMVISAEVPDVTGMSWSEDGHLYLAEDYGRGISRLPETGGASEALTAPDTTRGEIGHVCPSMFPDGKSLLVGIYGTAGWEVALIDVPSGDMTVLAQGICPRFLAPDLVFFGQGYRLLAARLDLAKEKLGEPVTVSEALFANLQAFTLQFDVSRNGDVLVIEDPDGPGKGLDLRRFDGTTESITPDVFDVEQFSMSPDGRFLALSSPYPVADPDIWLFDFETRDARKLTDDPRYDAFPTWAPDGTLYFASERRGQADVYQWVMGADTERLVVADRTQKYVNAVSPDHQWVLYETPVAGSGQDLVAAPTDGGVDRLVVASGPATQQSGRFAPDGRLVAYESDETGTEEVYVTDFPPSRPRQRVTVGGGSFPRWAPDGRSLYFVRRGSVFRVAVGPDGRPQDEPLEVMAGIAGEFELLPDGSGIIERHRKPLRSARLITRAAERVPADLAK